MTGISQLSAQEKEEKLIPEVSIAAKAKQQLHKTGKNVQLLTSKDLETYPSGVRTLTRYIPGERFERSIVVF